MKHGIIFSMAFLAVTCLSFADDLQGQKADYKLDKDPKRTSSMIKSGGFTTTVGALQQSTSGPAYEVIVNYKFTVSLAGTQQGQQSKLVDEKFFTPEFLEELRVSKHYEGDSFKANHLGYADAKNMDGKFYPHCDIIELYDIKDTNGFRWMGEVLGLSLEMRKGNMENLRVKIHVYPGVPVFGAVKLDMSGVYNGMNIKAGGDYYAR